MRVAGDLAGLRPGGAVEFLQLVGVELLVDIVQFAVLQVVQQGLIDVALALVVLVAQVFPRLVGNSGGEADVLQVHGLLLVLRL